MGLRMASVALLAWAMVAAPSATQDTSSRDERQVKQALQVALDVLPESLDAKNEGAHWRWVRVLEGARRKELVQALIDVSRSRYPEVRIQAVDQLGRIGGAAAVQRLRQATDDKEWEVRAAAITALLRADRDAAAELARKKIDDGSPTVLSRCLLVLRETSPEEAVKEAARKLGDGRAPVRWIATQSLMLSGKAGGPALAEAIAHERGEMKDEADVWRHAGDVLAFEHVWYVRALMAYALGQVSYKAAVPTLVEAAKDDVAVVALEALNALVELDPGTATKACLAAGKRENLGGAPYVLLWRVDTSAARRAAREAAQSKSQAEQQCGLTALAQIGDPEDYKLLTSVLKGKDSGLKLAVLRGMDPGWLWVDAGRGDSVLLADYGRVHPNGLHYPVERYRGGGGLHPDRRWPRSNSAKAAASDTADKGEQWRQLRDAVADVALKGETPELRWYALRALRCFFRTEADAGILAQVVGQEPDRYLAIEALDGLAEFGSEQHAAQVKVALQKASHDAVRRTAATTLLRLGGPSAGVELLGAAKAEPDRLTRAWLIAQAAESTANDPAQEARRATLPALLELLQHEDRITRSAAALALGATGETDAVEPLADVAEATLGGDQWGESVFEPGRNTLSVWLYFGDTTGHLEHYKYFYRVANEFSTEFSVTVPERKGLPPDSVEIREGNSPATIALGLVPLPGAIEALRKLGRHDDPAIREGAILGLALNPRREGDETIAQGLDDPDARVRRMAATVLPQTNLPDALARLKALIGKEKDLAVRVAAAQSIVRLVAEADATAGPRDSTGDRE